MRIVLLSGDYVDDKKIATTCELSDPENQPCQWMIEGECPFKCEKYAPRKGFGFEPLFEGRQRLVSAPTVSLDDLAVSEHKCISCGNDLAVLDEGQFCCINNSTTHKCHRYGLVTIITTANKI